MQNPVLTEIPSHLPWFISLHVSAPSMYLHSHRVFDQHGSQLPVHLKEDFPLAVLVQVAQSQGLDVQGLPPLQLHLQQTHAGSDTSWGTESSFTLECVKEALNIDQ